jgi:hypothetical protein
MLLVSSLQSAVIADNLLNCTRFLVCTTLFSTDEGDSKRVDDRRWQQDTLRHHLQCQRQLLRTQAKATLAAHSCNRVHLRQQLILRRCEMPA